jgi:RHS repeat-associated protein
VENNLRFPGQYYDAETGLHQNYFRDYDPILGRYIEADRLFYEMSTRGENIFVYAQGNPANNADFYGLDSKVATTVILPTVEKRIQEVSNRLRKENWDRDKSPGTFEFGNTVCEHRIPLIEISPKLVDGSCLKRCAIEHENVHADDCRKGKWTLWNRLVHRSDMERRGYEAELSCLKKCKEPCPNQ